MSTYTPRIVDSELDELLKQLPAVALEGAKGVGKTATAERRANTIFRLDSPAQRELAIADPATLLNASPPILLDEWQHAPAVWDAVRRAVDRKVTPNRFLLTGSASPTTPPTHSGAGRIVTVRMRPLALSERGLGMPTVSVRKLLAGRRAAITGHTDVALADYAREIVMSGFPGVRHLTGRTLRAQLDGYLSRIVQRDFLDQGHPVRKPETLRRWMAAYAAATATTTTLEKIRSAAIGRDGETPARTTVDAYREVLHQLWVVDPVPGWLPSRNRLTRLSQAPKHHFADAALAARLLGVDEGGLLTGTGPVLPGDGSLFGHLFESMVTQSVRVYAQAAEANVYHLREKDGRHEIDLIVERADQRVLAIETRLGNSVGDEQVKHLLWLKEQLRDNVLDTIIVTTGADAYRRADGVAVVPAALLGP